MSDLTTEDTSDLVRELARRHPASLISLAPVPIETAAGQYASEPKHFAHGSYQQILCLMGHLFLNMGRNIGEKEIAQ